MSITINLNVLSRRILFLLLITALFLVVHNNAYADNGVSISPISFGLQKGSSANYTVTVTNTSGNTIDKLTYGPTGTGDIRATAQSGCDSADLTGGNLTCNTSIPNDESKTFTFTFTIPSDGSSLNYIPANAWNDDTPLANLSPFVNLLPPTSATIEVSPNTGTQTVGTPFNITLAVNSTAGAFNAAKATVTVSSNLTISGIHSAP